MDGERTVVPSCLSSVPRRCCASLRKLEQFGGHPPTLAGILLSGEMWPDRPSVKTARAFLFRSPGFCCVLFSAAGKHGRVEPAGGGQ